jgi:two-component system sensor histidine kinase BaeS
VKFLATIVGVTTAAFVAVEWSMQPDSTDRATFIAMFSGAAVLSLALGSVAPGLLRRSRRVRRALLAPPLLAIGVAAGTVVVAAQLMFISSHDRNVALAALGLGTGLAIALSLRLSSGLQRDLAAIGDTATAVASGDRSTRTGIERGDELGTAAAAFDSMVSQLAAGEAAQRKLFASMGHDLRTPLTALRAAVEALQDGVATDAERYLRAMDCDIAALSELVDDLLLIARVEAGRYRPARALIDLADVAGEAVDAVAPVAIPRDITVTVRASGNTVVQGGRKELGRAVRNLLDNALRYSPDHGRVLVTVSNGGPLATLQVVDEGPGFAALGGSAFDEFTTTDPARTRDGSGFGLGLTIVRTVVEAHGGSASIEPGPGGRVVMRLPVAV